MTKYLVHLHPGMSQVVISLDGFGPTKGEGLKEIGSFDLAIDPNDAQFADPQDVNRDGEHPFIVEARKVLQDHIGEHNSTMGYTFLDRATNAVPDLEDDMDMSTDAIIRTEGEGDPEASTQAGGIKNAGTKEVHPVTQAAGGDAESPPATKSATGQSPDKTGNGTETGTDGSKSAGGDTEKPETVEELKTRIAGITDKAELQKVYETEQNGGNRTTAIAAIEARAAELEA